MYARGIDSNSSGVRAGGGSQRSLINPLSPPETQAGGGDRASGRTTLSFVILLPEDFAPPSGGNVIIALLTMSAYYDRPLHSHNSLMRLFHNYEKLLLFQLCRWGSRDTERLGDLFKVPQLEVAQGRALNPAESTALSQPLGLPTLQDPQG